MTGTLLTQRMAAVLAAAVGLFLLLGAFGHLDAVWTLARDWSVESLLLLLPGAILLVIGLFNLLATGPLWTGRQGVLSIALGLNTGLLAYLVFLLLRGVPGHPLLFFAGLVFALLVLLAASRFVAHRDGLVPTA
jgi:hypothetical protein